MIIKKIITVILLLILFCFSLTVNAIDYFSNPDEAIAEAEKQLEEGNIDEALMLYNFIFLLTEKALEEKNDFNEEQQLKLKNTSEEYKEKISELRKHEDLTHKHHSIGI